MNNFSVIDHFCHTPITDGNVKVVKVTSQLAAWMQVGGGQSCASSSPLRAFPGAKRRPAESTHEGRAQDPDSPNPLSRSHPSCSVLALWKLSCSVLRDKRGGHRRAAFPMEPWTSTFRLEEICSTILWPPASRGWARTEGKGRDLGGGQAFSMGSSFAPHVPSSTPHWSF